MPAISDCPCSGGTLDKLVQPAILAALADEPIHGYRLAERIDAITGHCGETPDVSGIYRSLKKMEASGLVTSTWEAGTRGHAKRLFAITSQGRACLARWTTTLETYLAAVSNLLREAKAATACKPKRHGRS